MTQTWNLAPVFVLRHAGFPFDWIEALGVSSAVVAAGEAVFAAEQALVSGASPSDTQRVFQALRTGQVPGAPKPKPADWSARLDGLKTAKAAFETALEAEQTGLRRRLREYAVDAHVQEAVFLSSPDMHANVWRRFLEADPAVMNANARRDERQVYSYLQRLCAKNETTSFFGPMGYGAVEGEDDKVEVQHVGRHAEKRRTFLAFWAVQELAKAVSKEPAFRPHLRFRANPAFRIVGPDKAICPSNASELPLTPVSHAVLERLRSPMSLGALRSSFADRSAELEPALVQLAKAGAIVRGLEFETQDFEVFGQLIAEVASFPESERRTFWVEKLRALDAIRGEFQSAAFPQRPGLLGRLEAAFTELTAIPARRGEGKMYTDRLVIYEEAASPFRLRFGKAFARKLETLLTPGLELSASFGDQVQTRYRSEVKEKLPSGTELDFLTYASRLRPEVVEGSKFSPVESVTVPAAKADGRLGFDLLGTSEAGSRYALPDVCLSGTGKPGAPDDIDVTDVLMARLHHHLLLWCWLGAFFDDRARFEGGARRWIAAQKEIPVLSLSFSRRNKGFYAYPSRRIAYTPGDIRVDAPDDLLAGELSVKVSEQGPILKGPDGKQLWLYLPLADFSTYPPFAALTHPLVLHAPLRLQSPVKGHMPPMRVGEAMYQRERWELDFAALESAKGPALMLEVLRLRREHGLPRFVFARVKGERKPVLMDTESPFAAELVRHLLQKGTTVLLEAMYPTPEDLFLRDERGRYTFELRMQWTRGPLES